MHANFASALLRAVCFEHLHYAESMQTLQVLCSMPCVLSICRKYADAEGLFI